MSSSNALPPNASGPESRPGLPPDRRPNTGPNAGPNSGPDVGPDSAAGVARAARDAARVVSQLSTTVRNAVLQRLAASVESHAAELLAANQRDLDAARTAGLPEAKVQRLVLTAAGLRQMADGLRQVAALPDPVGQVTVERRVPSGLHVQKVRCPLGVILMIYEARPNVTVDAFALCFKAGNACLLKGGREAVHSNSALAALIHAALAAEGVPRGALALLTTSDREELRALLQLSQWIDLVIPRGGKSLIEFVHQHSRIPMVQHFEGVCHIFVHAAADPEQALPICLTAKTSAPATCNAAECILVDEALADAFIPRLVAEYVRAGVEVRGDERVCRLAPGVRPAVEADWGREFLDLIVAVRVVAGLEGALAHIARYSSNHTEAILTRDAAAADEFTRRVQSSAVMVNASTRFNDGYQLGLGAEIGISTCKIHAYGPMGLEELTSQRYVVRGNGQTR